MKKTLSFVIALLLMLQLAPMLSAPALADEGLCGTNATWSFNSTTGVLTIGGTGPMTDYSDVVNRPWHGYRYVIKSVVVNSGVTTIGKYAFCDISAGGSVTIPNTVVSIGEYAYNSTEGFTGTVVIPDSVKSIGVSAFAYCTGLTGLTLGSGLLTIGGWAFGGCTGMRGDLTIGDSVLTVGYSSFTGSGFDGQASIGKNVSSIGDGAFTSCPSLTAINVSADNTSYSSADGILCNKAQTTLIQCPGGKTGALVIPSTVTAIGDSAMYGCKGLTGTLTFPAGLTSMGDYVFQDCTGLTGDIVFPAGIDGVPNGTFRGCSGFDGDLILHSGVWAIGWEAFMGCSGLKGTLTLPEALQSTGFSVFEGCGFTGTVAIPAAYTNIGLYSFKNCPGISGFDVASGNKNYASKSGILYNKALTTLICCPAGMTGAVSIESTATKLEQDAFYGCAGITGELVIPAKVTSITRGSFVGCTQMTDITAASANTAYASRGGILYNKAMTMLIACPAGKSGTLSIADTVRYIEHHAFEGCTLLTGTLTLPDSLTSIGGSAFAGCTGFTGSVVIPKDVFGLGTLTFSGCTGITAVCFRGDAPDVYNAYGLTPTFPQNMVLRYLPQAEGWETPTWCGYKTELWKSVYMFTDVPENAYYFDAVSWALDEGITAGTSGTAFSPENGCTRAQVVSFLWRAMGCPEPTLTVSPFADVKDSQQYYYKAVLWAFETGVTAGVSETAFAPEQTCTRGQFVAFLWRALDKPAPTTQASPFTDVTDTAAYYYAPVLWAKENGVVAGATETTFVPERTCTRCQVVSFLYRALENRLP